MSLARVKTWNPGDILTANDLNNEFNNVLNNPISLVSPTTGAINFNSQAHTNFVLQNVGTTQTPATAGLVFFNTSKSQVEVDDGTNMRYVPTVTSVSSGDLIIASSSKTWGRLGIGTTGQVLSVTSSNTAPTWGVIPPDGGLSTGSVSTGAVYYISTDGKYVPLAIGTSGQILTVSTASKPSWATAASGGSAAYFSAGVRSTTETYHDHFFSNTTGGTVAGMRWEQAYINTQAGSIALIPSTEFGHSVARFDGNTNAGGVILSGSTGIGSSGIFPFEITLSPKLAVSLALTSSANVEFRCGLTASTDFSAGDPTNGIYVRATGAMGSTWFWVGRTGGTEFTQATTAVTSTSVFADLYATITSSGASLYAGGSLQGTFTSSQIPSTGTLMTFGLGHAAIGAKSPLCIDAWEVTQDRV